MFNSSQPTRKFGRFFQLFCALAAVLALTRSLPAQTQSPVGLVPHVICQYYDSTSGYLQVLLKVTSSASADQVVFIGAQNYFSPGSADQGQPVEFSGNDPVGDNPFYVSYRPDAFSSLSWHLDGHTATMSTSSPPCTQPSMQINPLQFSAAGTFSKQYLGQVLHASAGFSVTATAATVNPPVSVTNLQISSTAPTNIAPIGDDSQFLYGDVTVTNASAATVPLIFTTLNGQLQLTTAESTLTLTGPPADSAGCAANITPSLAGTVNKAAPFLSTNFWTQTVTITNPSQIAVTGPIQLALTNLSPNARLMTAGGVATCPGTAGAPYVTIANGLAPGANAAIVLVFTNSGFPNTAITYTPVLLNGGSRL